MSSSAPSVRLEVYVQSLAPTKNRRIGLLLERVNQLEASGVIDSSDVYVVGKELCTETALTTDSGKYLCGRILQIRDWAKRTNKQLGSFFRPESVESTVTNEEYETIPLPTFTLAEFADDTLRFVTPCADGDSHYTPQDRLDTLDAAGVSHKPDRQSLKN